MSMKVEKSVEFRISRFDPQTKKSYVSRFKVPVRTGMTLLDALLYIKDNLDETLSFRQSCGMEICGYCARNVNVTQMLAVYTQGLHLNADSLVIESI